MAQLDPQIPLSAMGADPNQPQRQLQNAMQVFQLKDAMQQRQQGQRAAMDEKKLAKKLQTMTEKGTGLFLRYQGLKDQGFSESAAHAAMQEDWKREIGGLAALRHDDGSPMFETSELGQLGQEFKAGELGMALTGLMGANSSMEAYFKTRDSKTSDQKNFAAAEADPAFATFLEKTNRSKAPQVNVSTGQMPLDKPTTTQMQKDVAFGSEQLGNLDAVAKDYQGSFLTYGGKLRKFTSRQREKLDPNALAPEERQTLMKQTRFEQQVNRVFNAYRREITGAAAAIQELESLKSAILNTDLSPSEFEAAYASYRSEIGRTLRLKRKLLREGINVGDEKEFGQALDQAFIGGVDDSAVARGEELEAQGADGSAILETLQREGYLQ